MEVVDDVCESEGVCEVMCDVVSVQSEQAESMETHVSEEEAAQMAKSASDEDAEHTDYAVGVHSTADTSAESLKPRYSYRLVFK